MPYKRFGLPVSLCRVFSAVSDTKKKRATAGWMSGSSPLEDFVRRGAG